MHKRTHHQNPQTADDGGQRVGEGERAVGPAHILDQRVDKHPESHHGAGRHHGGEETRSQYNPAVEEPRCQCRMRERGHDLSVSPVRT